MKRIILIGIVVTGLMLLGLALRAEADSEGGVWHIIGDRAACERLSIPPDSICVDWFAPEAAEDGTICCVRPINIPRNSFDDCEAVVGRRLRPSDTLE